MKSNSKDVDNTPEVKFLHIFKNKNCELDYNLFYI